MSVSSTVDHLLGGDWEWSLIAGATYVVQAREGGEAGMGVHGHLANNLAHLGQRRGGSREGATAPAKLDDE